MRGSMAHVACEGSAIGSSRPRRLTCRIQHAAEGVVMTCIAWVALGGALEHNGRPCDVAFPVRDFAEPVIRLGIAAIQLENFPVDLRRPKHIPGVLETRTFAQALFQARRRGARSRVRVAVRSAQCAGKPPQNSAHVRTVPSWGTDTRIYRLACVAASSSGPNLPGSRAVNSASSCITAGNSCG